MEMTSEDCKKLQKNLILNFIVVGMKICFYCSFVYAQCNAMQCDITGSLLWKFIPKRIFF